MLPTQPHGNRTRVEVVSGVPAILESLPRLSAAAADWGQSAELAELPFLLSVPVRPRRRPLLVLLHTAGESPDACQLYGAVLLFAYGAALFGDRLLAHGDRLGRRGVFASPQERTSVTVAAARAMVLRGAALVSVAYLLDSAEAASPQQFPAPLPEPLPDTSPKQEALAHLGMLGLGPAVQWTLRGALRRLYLPIERDLNTTLQRVGKRTRRNLRAALRLCRREMGARLEWNPPVSAEELERVNVGSTHPVRHGVISWRHAVSSRSPEAFLAGLRTSRGEWMALAGGRRSGDTITIDWQMNVKTFARFSVSLVMRGLLIDRFATEGATRLRFEGGTTHTLVRAFHTGIVYTFRAQRKSIWLRTLERFLTAFFPSRAITLHLFGRTGR